MEYIEKDNTKNTADPPSFRPLSQQDLDLRNVGDLMLVQGRYEELSLEQKKEMQRLEKQYVKRTKMPSDPHDPFFYHVYEYTLPREDHYRIIPQGTSSFIFFWLMEFFRF